MKRLTLIASGALLVLAGQAHAGGGCIYGKQQASLASVEQEASQTPLAKQTDATDPALVALLKKQENERKVPPIHN